MQHRQAIGIFEKALYEYLPGFFCSADPHSLSNNIVRTVYEDRTGTIRVGTMDGLNKLDRESR